MRGSKNARFKMDIARCLFIYYIITILSINYYLLFSLGHLHLGHLHLGHLHLEQARVVSANGGRAPVSGHVPCHDLGIEVGGFGFIMFHVADDE
jgi:hypothetical protein